MQDFVQPESVHLDEILVSTGSESTDDAKKVAAAKSKAEDIEAKLNAGGDFAQLARTFSDGPTAAGGGDLGDYKRGQLPQQLEDKVFPLKAGQWTEPILTRQGWIILKVTQHTAAGVAPFKQVESQVDDALYMSRMEPAIRSYLNKMRDNASIFIAPGYTDTAATPNELHSSISFSAYTPPAPKKKAHVERTRFRETGRSFRNKQGAAPAKASSNPPEASAKAKSREEQAIERPGKKEKIRFGQKPRETLPAASTDASSAPTVEDAGALPETAEQQPENPLDAAPPQRKTRYSDLARNHKDKKKAQTQTDTFAATPVSAAEAADRQIQSTPLGLDGNTANQKKDKATKGKKERYSQQPRKPEEQPVFTPAPPVQGAPAPSDGPGAPSTSTPQQ